MEFVPHGSLQSYLKINRETLQTKQLLKYSSDIAKVNQVYLFGYFGHRFNQNKCVLGYGIFREKEHRSQGFGRKEYSRRG